jgi:hypothetical protein
MISDEPDEDANYFDDDMVLDSLFGGDSPTRESGADIATPMADWPPLMARHAGLNLDPGTLAWFKANHADWQAEIGFILRTWVRLKAPAPKALALIALGRCDVRPRD